MQKLQEKIAAYLLLADGTVFEGRSFGAAGTTIGETVFTTGMTAYQETLTDPSYHGQLVTQTFPLIGNYGVNSEDGESNNVYAQGYIVREWCDTPSNFRAEENIDRFLKEHNVIGIWDIDTRALTRRLRGSGVMNGMITTENVFENMERNLAQVREFKISDAVMNVSIKEAQKYLCDAPKYEVALLDYGYKRNIRRSLLTRDCNVTVLPAHTTAAEISAGGYDGVMLSNGPGDPQEDAVIIKNLREISALGLPVFGICLGHQLMALAMGGKTGKLKYGHRGANQPVIDLDTGTTYVTSQNHGFEVLSTSIPAEVGRLTHVNANDQSCEGVRYGDGSIFTVQFHPEACGGPTDTSVLFDRFIDMMKTRKGAGVCR